jgi:hypothetical protein
MDEPSENTMGTQKPPKIPLTKGWRRHVRSAMLHVISLAQYATAYTHGWAANSVNTCIRLKAELERANQEITLLHEETRIKDARTVRINPYRRPHYPPTERLAILELKAARKLVARTNGRRLPRDDSHNCIVDATCR